jgi:hypothetical protein
MKTALKISTGLGALATVAAVGAMAISPAVYADTEPVEVKLNVGSNITIARKSSESGSVVLGTSTSAVNTGSATFTVETNNYSGYKLSINGSVSSGALSDSGSTYTIPAVANSVSKVINNSTITDLGTGSSITAGTSAFGFNLKNDATYFKVPGTATDVKTTTGPAISGEDTVVYFGAGLSASQPSGNYSNTITMTAVANS